ncbi:Na+/H+ antiporter subunit D [Spiractinospora alimapuensis]|uniref:Na+/H+ antiporter subunit D n=1 Tax=Spiractinospora alimapuensis TaxID=2820884 RepID=UPI001EEB50A9|nr:Na+/H+ antiporter subunit D [Spiractinospora alimapuensis]QVQ53541.1 Na+/H+ antiporter subunit D [Spiractinospora alimapuensis]
MTGIGNVLVPVPVILPLLAAGIKFLIGAHQRRLREAISVTVLVTIAVVAGVLLYQADRYGPQVAQAGGWPAPVGISLVADRFAALVLLVSALVTLFVLIYALGQGLADEDDTAPLAIFHPSYLVLMAGVACAFLAGDLFNLFVGFEILLTASYVLITLGGTAARIRAGTTYVIINLFSSLVFLVAIAFVYAATGTINLAQLSHRLAELDPGVAQVLQLMLLLGFAIKAAVFPLSAWLPDSYPTASAPVTAVFAGLLTKVGVYTMIRTQTLLFPDNPLTVILAVAAILTMVVGILGALAQDDIKRLLSFTLVSHVGFMVFGIALATQAAIAGAVFYIVHHITVQTALFLTVGLIERRTGTTSKERLGGLIRVSPLLGVLFFVPAMSLGGIPPFSGFMAKLGLLQAGIGVGGPTAWALVIASLATSLLTLYAVCLVWNRSFWGERGQVARDGQVDAVGLSGKDIVVTKSLPRTMVWPTGVLIAVMVGYTVVAGPLADLADRTAEELLDPESNYIQSVPFHEEAK